MMPNITPGLVPAQVAPIVSYLLLKCLRTYGGFHYRRIGHAGSFTCRAVTQKLDTQNQKEDQISIRTTPDNAESEVFLDSRRIFHDFFLEKVILYGEVAIKSRYLEANP